MSRRGRPRRPSLWFVLVFSAGCGYIDNPARFGPDEGASATEETSDFVCGDGVVEGAEECDHGPFNDDSGACTSDCTLQSCGDGFVGLQEECDDGNDDDSDACLSTCVLASCGDGHVQAGGEACDDGNISNEDACLQGCVSASCGDGLVHAGVEECDDGNLNSGDACTQECKHATCGDGYVELFVEACDDGNQAQDDACLDDCTLASCGDGLVHTGVEACDDGNDLDDDDCVGECELASCGDGFVNVGVEECDDGELEPGDGCSAQCQLEYRYVFVSSQRYTGDLGGLEGADAECQQLADSAGLPGTYMAWLSSDESEPASRFTQSAVPYRLRNGAQIAPDWEGLVDGTIDTSINLTESGQNPPSSSGCQITVSVWTNTRVDGTLESPSYDCSNWSSTNGNAYHGRTDVTSTSWTDYSSSGCSCLAKIYCFQQ